jgi:hypothetical protein
MNGQVDITYTKGIIFFLHKEHLKRHHEIRVIPEKLSHSNIPTNACCRRNPNVHFHIQDFNS